MSIGPNDDSRCYQGSKTTYYIKKQNFVCKSQIKNLKKIPVKNCKCMLDDFQW